MPEAGMTGAIGKRAMDASGRGAWRFHAPTNASVRLDCPRHAREDSRASLRELVRVSETSDGGCSARGW